MVLRANNGRPRTGHYGYLETENHDVDVDIDVHILVEIRDTLRSGNDWRLCGAPGRHPFRGDLSRCLPPDGRTGGGNPHPTCRLRPRVIAAGIAYGFKSI